MVKGFLNGLTDFCANSNFGVVFILSIFFFFLCFRVTDGHFMDFVIFGDYIALPRCLGSKVLMV